MKQWLGPYNGTQQSPRPFPQSWLLPSPPSTIAHYNGTLQWHPAMALRPLPQSTPQWHPAMAPSNGTTPTSPNLVVTPTIAHYNGTLQWHYVHSPNHSTLEWHPAMAPSNGTTSTPPKLVVTLSFPYHSTRHWHPAMAPNNFTTCTALCNGTRVPRPIRQSGSSPSPPLGSKNPL